MKSNKAIWLFYIILSKHTCLCKSSRFCVFSKNLMHFNFERTMTLYATRIIQAHIVRRITNTSSDAAESPWQHLLLRRTASKRQFPNMWQVVTGTIEEGETPTQTAFREIEEETGLQPNELWVMPHVGIFYDSVRDIMNLVPCFAAVFYDFVESSSHSPISVRLSDEHSEYEWCDVERSARQLVIPSHIQGVEVLERHILPLLAQGELPVFARHFRES
jgi:dATP pyrophosphohydrolase